MNKDEKPEIVLKVAEAFPEERDRGIVKIPSDALKKLGVKPGDFVEIVGQKSTVAIADRGYITDASLNIARMDFTIRKNAGVSIGENVVIRKLDSSEIAEAEVVTLAPLTHSNIKESDFLVTLLRGRPLTKGDEISVGRTASSFDDDFINAIFMSFSNFGVPFFGETLRFLVINTVPKGYVYITENTQINISLQSRQVLEEAKIRQVSYEDIGGLDDAVSKIREMVEIPLRHPEIFMRLGIEPPKGVLLYGPPGTGKTLLARAVASESGASFFSINGPEIISKWVGDAEKRLREIFENAEKNAPSIIFIDEIDAIAPKREESTGEVEHRVVSQLLTLMDGLKGRGNVIVIAATNRPNAIDPALRRPGRFDREIYIGVPDEKGRLQILKIHTRKVPLDKEVNLEYLAKVTHGFVGADLEALVKEAAMNAIRRNIDALNISKDEKIPRNVLENLYVTMSDFEEALRFVRPSAMREVLIERPNVKWEDIGGLDAVKQRLIEVVEWPLKYPNAFKELGISAPKGVLLYGPPGTGKTLLARAVAGETEYNFILVKGPEIFSKYVGESERNIREIFDRAKRVAPSIIFIDEIDAIAASRDGSEENRVESQVVNALLNELDGLEPLKNVIVIAATNRIELIDPAILRAGRFDEIVFVPPPSLEERKSILRVYLSKMPVADKENMIEMLAARTEGFVGADIEKLAKYAALIALRRNIDSIEKINNGEEKIEVKKEDFEAALELVKPSLTKDQVDYYIKQAERFYKSREIVKKEEKYFG
ncbi:MAG: CDC48 family AAA ATPase [Candidatus Parvarchaeota archaeon]|nr:CDC48 family AAA ATPase [Candidatus Rehaiarchaeum fermentans]MCW1293401.1 CDC48 family AAA ATPase [Candidatus Rehaiarchaeum fermentans]